MEQKVAADPLDHQARFDLATRGKRLEVADIRHHEFVTHVARTLA